MEHRPAGRPRLGPWSRRRPRRPAYTGVIPGRTLNHPLFAFLRALTFLGAVIAYGVVGYIVIESYPFLDALFMTVITITTVGYDIVRPLDTAGKVFTITLIASGVIGFLYTFGVLVEQLSSGRWAEYRSYRRMNSELRDLRDHVIVCGYGRTGAQVVRDLEAQRQPYVVVEMNPTPLQAVRHDERLHIVGDAASDEVLATAGIERARALVSAVDSDERNVYIVLTARSLNPALFIVARSSYPDSVPKLQRAGADRVVSPYSLSGSRMADLALQPAVVDVIDLVMSDGSHRMAIEELVVPGDLGEQLTAGTLRGSGATLLAVRTGDGHLSVGPDDPEPLHPDDVVIAVGTREQLATLATVLRPPRH
jgi:voltage-gated potassium channel